EDSSGGDTLTITGMLSNNSGGTLDLLGAGDKGSIGNGMTNAGLVDVDNGSTLKITGNVNNSGTLETSSYYGTGNNTITITGGLTNSGNFFLRQNGDVANVATLTNTGTTSVATGATLNLTSQPNGITDAVAGSTFDLAGTFNAGGNSGFANLNSVEGTVNLYGQSFTDTPGSGTLTISNGGQLTANYNSGTGVGTALTIKGDVNNSGSLDTGVNTNGGNTLTITGMLTNNSGAGFELLGAGDTGSIGNGMSNAGIADVDNGSTLKITGNVNNSGNLYTGNYYGGNNTITITGGLTNSGDFFLERSGDVANVATLTNTGYTSVATGATLNLTGQPNGITDAVAGSRFDLAGTFNAGGNSGFANLNSVEGTVNLYGQSFTDTPGSGTLTISNGGQLTANYNSGTGVGTAL